MKYTFDAIVAKFAAGRLSATAETMLQAIRAAEHGVSRRDLRTLTGRSESTVESTLAAMRACGLVATTNNGGWSVWTTPERLQEVRAHVLSTLKFIPPEVIERRRMLKRAEHLRAKDRAHRPIETRTVRVVAAASAPPIKLRGPCSVFHLGAMQ